MSIAKGQDPAGNTFLQNTPSSVNIAIPTICYIEALSTWETQTKNSHKFQEELDRQINELERNLLSPQAKSMLSHLQQWKIERQGLLNDIQVRLFQTIALLLNKAEMIQLNTSIIRQISEINLMNNDKILIKNDIIDNLILDCILSHAGLHPTEDKLFLSGNSDDFGKPPKVKKALQDAGVKYFPRTQDFLGWLNSQPQIETL